MLRDVEPWRAWDATDDEYAELRIIREPIPDPLDKTVNSWLLEYFGARTETSFYETVVRATVTNGLEAAPRVPLPTHEHPQNIVRNTRETGEQHTLRVIDTERNSVVKGKRVAVRVDLGGRRRTK